MDEPTLELVVMFYSSPDAFLIKFSAAIKIAAWAVEMLMCFDWHPLTDTNATVSNTNVTS